MATDLLAEPQVAGTDIAMIVAQNPVTVLVDTNKRDELYAHIQHAIDEFVPDLTSKKGRDAIKALAFKITRTKTAIDDAGKKLNEEARAKINIVDAARRDSKATLEAMATAVRQPLTDWETAEDERIHECKEAIARLWNAAIISPDDTVAEVRQRGTEVYETVLDPDRFGDMLDEAQSAKDKVIATLKAALARLVQEEADRAELERLRAEAAEREARETAEREAREQAEREAEEARLADERKAAAEKAEADRIAQAEQAAAQRARDEAETKHAAELATERKRAEEAEQAAQAERDQAAAAQRKRDAQEKDARDEAERLAAEQAKRDRNRAHVSRVMTEIKEALMSCGADEETAKKIVLAIKASEIPHVTVTF